MAAGPTAGAAAPELPAAIGRYRVEALIGRGAMGVLYRAHDPDIDREVAIKLVRADLLDGDLDDEFMARFRREAQAAARCVHPNIVAIYDFAVHEGQPFIAMEFVPGESLRARLTRETRLAPEAAVDIIVQVLDALGAAHAAGIVHRDVKAANILLPGGGRVKMTDFGIARVGGADLTVAGAVLGTPSTMSPEQCRGEEVDARSDLFSAGIVLFEMLAGARPFPGRGAGEIMQRILHEPPAPLPPEITPPVREAVLRALAKRPEDRFASAAAMRAALRPDPDASATLIARSGASVSAEEVDRLTRALAQHLGPIARVLVKRALPAASAEALRTSLAAYIENRADRAAFLAVAQQSPRGNK